MVDSGIILIKYWLEVSPEEQTRRLEGRINDPRKTWKLTDMDLKSYGRWDDYSRARDAMFAATDTPWAPWFIAHTDDKKRGRLNIISHLLEPGPLRAARAAGTSAAEAQGQSARYGEPNLTLKLHPDAVLTRADPREPPTPRAGTLFGRGRGAGGRSTGGQVIRSWWTSTDAGLGASPSPGSERARIADARDRCSRVARARRGDAHPSGGGRPGGGAPGGRQDPRPPGRRSVGGGRAQGPALPPGEDARARARRHRRRGRRGGPRDAGRGAPDARRVAGLRRRVRA